MDMSGDDVGTAPGATPASFARELRALRQAAGLSQEALAERAGVSVRGVSDLERGLHPAPQRETIARLARALGLDAAGQRRLRDLARRSGAGRRPPAHAGAATAETAPGGTATLDVSSPSRVPAAGPTPGAFLGAAPAGRLVGREEHMRGVARHIALASEGHGQMVLLRGSPGSGKTRLAQEVSMVLLGQGYLVATGRCYDQEQTMPYAPIRSALAHAYTAAPPTVRATSRRWPALTRLLDPTEGSGEVGDAGSDAPQRLFSGVVGFLLEIALARPLALLIDDLHWADGATLSLLLYLARHTREARILLLATYRISDWPGGPPSGREDFADILLDLDREELAENIALAPLDRAATAAMAAGLLDGPEVSPALADAVHRVTEGNPFFVRQVVRALVEQGAIQARHGVWISDAGGDIPVPDTVRAVIRQRCARLSERTRTILGVASVLGHAFDVEDLRRTVGVGEAEIDQALDEAATLGVAQPVGAEQYAFDHMLTQQALYADVSPRRRRGWHRAAVAAIEQRPEPDRRRRAAEMARHAVQGGELGRAAPYAILAGDEAELVWAHAEAEGHYRMALALAREGGDERVEAHALEKLGGVLGMLSRPDEALNALEEGAALYRRLDDREGEGRATAGIGAALADRGAVGAAVARLETMRAALEGRGQGVSARLSYALSAVLYGAGRYDEAMAAARRASEEALAAGDRRLWAAAECYRGDVLMQLRRPTEAQRVLAAVRPVAEAAGDLDSLAHSVHDLASVALLLGRMDEAEARIVEALELHLRRGVPAMIGAGLLLHGWILYYRGSWRQARAILDQGMAALRELPPSWQTVVGLVWLGRLDAAEGRWESAARHAREAIAMGEGTHLALPLAYQTLAERALTHGDAATARAVLEPLAAGDSLFVGLMLPTLVEARLATGSVAEAERTITALLGEMGTQVPLVRVEALRAHGMVRERQGHLVEAEASFAAALHLAHGMPYAYAEARILGAWGHVRRACGDTTGAGQRLREAMTIARALGAEPYIATLVAESSTR